MTEPATVPVLTPARNRLDWRPYIIAIIVIGIGMAIPAIGFLKKRESSEWTAVFVEAAIRLRHGQTIFWPDGYVYPPFSALLALPFSFLPGRLSRGLWYLICLACLCLLVRISWALSGGDDDSSRKSSGNEHLIFLISCAIAIRFSFNALSHLQTDLAIDVLLVAGLYSVTRMRFSLAAIWWGLSAAFKGPSLLMVVYLIWRKKFLQSILMLAVTAGVNLLPNLVSTPPEGGLWLTSWAKSYLKPFGRDDTPGKWYNDIKNNQSISGAINRWLMTTPSTSKAGVQLTTRPSPPSPQALKLATMSTSLGLLIVTAALFFLSSKEPRIPKEVLQCTLLFMLTLLLSPMTSRSHFPIILLPTFCIARIAVYENNKFCWGLLILTFIGAITSMNFTKDKNFVEMAFWFGAVMFCAVFLYIGCAYLLTRDRTKSTLQPS